MTRLNREIPNSIRLSGYAVSEGRHAENAGLLEQEKVVGKPAAWNITAILQWYYRYGGSHLQNETGHSRRPELVRRMRRSLLSQTLTRGRFRFEIL